MFGLTSEVILSPSGSSPVHERGKLRKGNALANRHTAREMILQERSLVLPDIKTTQLVQQSCDVTNMRTPVENPLSRTERRLLLKQGRLKESWTSDIEQGLKELDGLTGCKLFVDSKHDVESSSAMSNNIVKLDKRQKSRLSKARSDSGFFDERLDSLTTGAQTAHSPESNRCGSDLSLASDHDRPPVPSQEYQETKRPAVKLSPVLKDTKSSTNIGRMRNVKPTQDAQSQQANHITWNTEVTEDLGRDPDSFSTESFISDKEISHSFMVLPSCGQTIFSSQCSEHAHEHRVKMERKARNSPREDYGISVALLKNRRRLLSRRAGENNVGNLVQDKIVAESRAKNPKAQRTRQLSGDYRQKNESFDKCLENVEDDSEVSSISLTKECVLKVTGKQEFIDVNAKCEEWLNRWLAVNNTTEEPGFVEPCY